MEETSDFLQSLAKFFSRAHSVKVKHAYAELFAGMLLPLAPKATAEVNYPGWAAAVETLYPKASKMALKPKHWQVAHPLQATLLCVSRRAHFLERWLTFIETALHPPRSGVGTAWRGGSTTGSSSRHLAQALGSVSRLVWVYLYRCQESYTASTKKLDIVVKLLFPPGRRMPVGSSSDSGSEDHARILYLLSMKDLAHTTRTILLPLMGFHGELASTGSEETLDPMVPLDALLPERSMLALWAFLACYAEMERGEMKPAFPMPGTFLEDPCSSTEFGLVGKLPGGRDAQLAVHWIGQMVYGLIQAIDPAYGHHTLLDDRCLHARNLYSSMLLKPGESKGPPYQYQGPGMGHSSTTPHSMYEGIVGGMEVESGVKEGILSSSTLPSSASVSGMVPSPSAASTTTTASSSSSVASAPLAPSLPGWNGPSGMVKSYGHLTTLSSRYPRDRTPYYSLMRRCAGALPHTLPDSLSNGVFNPARQAEILGRWLVHVDAGVASAAAAALLRLAKVGGGAWAAVGTVSRLVGRMGDRFGELLWSAWEPGRGLLHLYVELLEAWMDELKAQGPKTKEKGKRGGPSVSMDGAGMWNLVDETEANGLVLLCSAVPGVRMRAVEVLGLAASLERRYSRVSRGLEVVEEEEREEGGEKKRISRGGPPHVEDILWATGAEVTSWALAPTTGGTWGGMDRKGEEIEEDYVEVEEAMPDPTHPFWSQAPDKPKPRLAELTGSSDPRDGRLWSRLFPRVIRRSAQECPITVALCREAISGRLNQMQPLMSAASGIMEEEGEGGSGEDMMGEAGKEDDYTTDGHHHSHPHPHGHRPDTDILQGLTMEGGMEGQGNGPLGKGTARVSSGFVTQWALYVRFACATVTASVDAFTTSTSAASGKHGAHGLFKQILPFLMSDNERVRNLVVDALGSVHRRVYGLLLDELRPFARRALASPPALWSTDARSASQRNMGSSGQVEHALHLLQGTSAQTSHTLDLLRGSPVPSHPLARLRLDLTVVYGRTARFLRCREWREHAVARSTVMHWMQETRALLADPGVQGSWKAQGLRIAFSRLVGEVALAGPEVLPFGFRVALFDALEEWCGHGRSTRAERRLGRMDRRNIPLEVASMQAMAILCGGPLRAPPVAGRVAATLQLDVLLSWVDDVYLSGPDRVLDWIVR